MRKFSSADIGKLAVHADGSYIIIGITESRNTQSFSSFKDMYANNLILLYPATEDESCLHNFCYLDEEAFHKHNWRIDELKD